ncbi:MAG: B12-binding domain-containing radical SAM protein [Candidatus Eremiobacteraeota bacterium]|nr:B12-binding domain-containing radical SAM protein [Candidatus Eremiobacteraeota bacterium]
MRIALLSPRGPLYRHRSGIFKKSLRYAPLTLTTLASLVPAELDCQLQLVDEGIDQVDLELEADLVGISAITGTASRAYELARHFRARGMKVVLGGVHPTLVPDEAQSHADCVVTGYAEDSWPQLLRDFSVGRLAARYSQRHDLSLAGRPFPRRDLLRTNDYLTPHTIEATRGCIHQCRFCVVPSAWGRPLQRPVAEVVADIEQMQARRVVFLDLNLIADVDYAKQLFRALAPLGIGWAGLATTMLAWDEELLELAARSGCRGVLIGFETMNAEALAESGKKFNQRTSYDQVVRRIHDRGISIMGTFVFGFDSTGPETFDQVIAFCGRHCLELPRFSILTPFPGTPLFARLEREGRILSRDWSLYDGQHVVFRPAQMTPERLLEETGRVWRSVYSWRSIWQRLSGSRRMLLTSLAANLGYRHYGYNLDKFYTCGEVA